MDVVTDISFRHAIPIVVDTVALEDYGIGTDSPVSINLQGVSLKSALRLMLNELDLTYVLQHEVLQITTAENADKVKQTHVYKVDHLVEGGQSAQTLANLLEQMSTGQDSEIALFGQKVVVMASFDEHMRIMNLLHALSD